MIALISEYYNCLQIQYKQYKKTHTIIIISQKRNFIVLTVGGKRLMKVPKTSFLMYFTE